MGLGGPCPVWHEPMPALLLQGADGVPGLRGLPGQEGPGVSPWERVAECEVLSSFPSQPPQSTAGECPAPPCHPQLPAGFVAQGLVGMMATSLWPCLPSPNSKAPLTLLLAGTLILFFFYQQSCPNPANPFPGAQLGAPLFPRGLGAELPFPKGKEAGAASPSSCLTHSVPPEHSPWCICFSC